MIYILYFIDFLSFYFDVFIRQTAFDINVANDVVHIRTRWWWYMQFLLEPTFRKGVSQKSSKHFPI